MIGEESVTAEDIVSFLEKAYSIADNYKDGTYYEDQNDGCRFLLQEIVIYIVAILYKKKRFKQIRQIIKTTYFPDTTSRYVRDGIHLDSFYFYLRSLKDRNIRLSLRRMSIHADLLMQRATIKDIDVNFEDVRLADNLVLMLSEWFFKCEDYHMYWYPVTMVYATFGKDDCLQLRKYLMSRSRFKVICELFEVESEADFLRRYNELSILLKDENRRSGRCVIPSICSIIKAEDLFSKE